MRISVWNVRWKLSSNFAKQISRNRLQFDFRLVSHCHCHVPLLLARKSTDLGEGGGNKLHGVWHYFQCIIIKAKAPCLCHESSFPLLVCRAFILRAVASWFTMSYCRSVSSLLVFLNRWHEGHWLVCSFVPIKSSLWNILIHRCTIQNIACMNAQTDCSNCRHVCFGGTLIHTQEMFGFKSYHSIIQILKNRDITWFCFFNVWLRLTRRRLAAKGLISWSVIHNRHSVNANYFSNCRGRPSVPA